jgi:hypothetical protein
MGELSEDQEYQDQKINEELRCRVSLVKVVESIDDLT